MDMLHLLMNRIIDAISIQSLFSAWTRMSEFALVLWVLSFAGEDTWFVKTALTGILLVLLIAGVALLLFGLRDLVRDLRHILQERSHKRGHA
jgi:hypothetical protein